MAGTMIEARVPKHEVAGGMGDYALIYSWADIAHRRPETMKFGVRKPSLKRRVAARTSPKRFVRHKLGLKAPRGAGWLTDPKKAAYNRVYKRTTVGVDDLAPSSSHTKASRKVYQGAIPQPSSAVGRVLQLVAWGGVFYFLFKFLGVFF